MKKYLLLVVIFLMGCKCGKKRTIEDELVHEATSVGCNNFKVLTMPVIVPKNRDNSSYVKTMTTKACVLDEKIFSIVNEVSSERVEPTSIEDVHMTKEYHELQKPIFGE